MEVTSGENVFRQDKGDTFHLSWTVVWVSLMADEFLCYVRRPIVE